MAGWSTWLAAAGLLIAAVAAFVSLRSGTRAWRISLRDIEAKQAQLSVAGFGTVTNPKVSKTEGGGGGRPGLPDPHRRG
jgi:hypothetical protein